MRSNTTPSTTSRRASRRSSTAWPPGEQAVRNVRLYSRGDSEVMASPLISFVTRLLRRTPGWTRDLAVTIGGSHLLWQRRGGHYKQKLAEHRRHRTPPPLELP